MTLVLQRAWVAESPTTSAKRAFPASWRWRNARCLFVSAGRLSDGRGRGLPLPGTKAPWVAPFAPLDWLRADLVLRNRQLESGKPEARAEVSQKLNHWKVDRDLAGVRDPEALIKLPDDEKRPGLPSGPR